MTRFRSAFVFAIAASGILFGSPRILSAQDPKKPELPTSSDAPPSIKNDDRAAERTTLAEAQREIEILEAKIEVKKAEIEEIVARARRRQAQATLAKLVADSDRYRLTITINDVTRAVVPFPDTKTVVDLPPDVEKRVQRIIKDAVDSEDQPLLEVLDKKIVMAFPDKTPLEDVLKYFRTATKGDKLPNGIPISVDPAGIADAPGRMRTEVSMVSDKVALSDALTFVLKQAKLSWTVKDGLLTISGPEKPGAK